MKILIATGMYPPDIGGPATYSKLLYEELPKRGIQAEVLSYGRVRHLPRAFRHLSYALKLLWHGRSSDIIFSQDAFSVGMPALAVASILGKPLVVRLPGDYAWEQSSRFGASDSMEDFQHKKYGWKIEAVRRAQRLVLDRADRVIAPSKRFAEIVRGWLKDPSKVSPIYNGLDLSELARAVGGGARRERSIISAGRLVPGKGFAMLIRSMHKLEGWTLEIAGDGPDREKLASQIKSEGLEGRVTLLGGVDRQELFGRIMRSEIFALNTAFETFSFQIVEVMALGTPIVATRVGSLPELIEDGASGLLYEYDDEAGFLAAVRRVTGDKALRESLSAGGRARSKVFSIDTTVDAVKVVLTSLHDSFAARPPKRVAASKLLRYIFSGGMAAVTDLGLLYIFTDVFGMWYLLSSIVAFLFAFMVSFTLQKFFTFQDHGLDGVHGQAFTYLAVTSVNLGLNTGVIYLLVQYAGLHYLAAQIITSIVVAIESFVVYGMFIFKKAKPGQIL